jgi:glutamate 5-kinase
MTTAAGAGASRLASARRVVVKIGSALLVERSSGRVNRSWLEALAEDVARLRSRDQEVVLVSSGAIALGRRQLGLPAGKLKLEESQAAAAVGQIRLAHAWKEVLEHHDFTVAQVLLTLGDTEQRRRYLNARNTLTALLRLGSIPVINENDTVATAEIRYGDNDRLAARVAQMVSADCPTWTGCTPRIPPARRTRSSSPRCRTSRLTSRQWRAARRRTWARAEWRPRCLPRRSPSPRVATCA